MEQTAGISLDSATLAILHTRTEGWAAGLQLATLAMQHHPDTIQFVSTFAGSHRYILDYLFDEVISRQPDDVRGFLLATAILSQLTPSLCDAVSNSRGSQAMLERLERGNLFVLPLDESRQHYRYHRLFSDLLVHRLQIERSQQDIAQLHQRAGNWYEQNGPGLRFYQGWALFLNGQFENAVRILEKTDLLLAKHEANTSLRGELYTLLMRAAVLTGNADQAFTYAERAHHWLPDTDQVSRVRLLSGLALAHFYRGEFGAASTHVNDAMELAQGQTEAAISLLSALYPASVNQKLRHIEILVLQALAEYQQGKTTGAFITLEQALRLSEPEGAARPFLDEGQPMARLLQLGRWRSAWDTSNILPFAQRLIGMFPPEHLDPSLFAEHSHDLTLTLNEPLTDREIEVLRLLADGLSNREIAAALVLSVWEQKPSPNPIRVSPPFS